MVQASQLTRLNQAPPVAGDYVLYWMQQSHRAEGNAALTFAIETANRLELPVVVGFGLMQDYPEANSRHLHFMLEGLTEVAATLERRGIRFVMQRAHPADVGIDLGERAATVVTDRGYLRHQKEWRAEVASMVRCPMFQVETDVVIPVEAATWKKEFAARTIRPRIQRIWDEYLVPVAEVEPRIKAPRLEFGPELEPDNHFGILDPMSVDRTVAPVRRFKGGLSEARFLLDEFISQRLAGYGDQRSDPSRFQCAFLSPYLHFGQIGPLEVALAVAGYPRIYSTDRNAFLEQFVVRRELAFNFVEHEPNYDTYEALPDWARQTLADHRFDLREYDYTRAELEKAKTHDPYWNAAMAEMTYTGYMHPYMRMYWGKKILEWSRTPQEAYATALSLNNKYFIDGRDPVSFANVAWIFGLHDRPFTRRPVYGTVRSMSAKGLARKFDMDAYVSKVSRLVAAEG